MYDVCMYDVCIMYDVCMMFVCVCMIIHAHMGVHDDIMRAAS